MKEQKVITMQKMHREFKEWIVYQDGTYVRGERREMPMKHINDVIKEEEDKGHIVWLETEIYYCDRKEYIERIALSLTYQDTAERAAAKIKRYQDGKDAGEDRACEGGCGSQQWNDHCACWEVAIDEKEDAELALVTMDLSILQQEGRYDELPANN